jgi:hypothetical protein
MKSALAELFSTTLFLNLCSRDTSPTSLPVLKRSYRNNSFERFADKFGVTIKEYLSDTHPFKSGLIDSGQKQTGNRAHHQNRVERTCQTIFNWTRATMLHFCINWPQEGRLVLCPFALDYAVWLWNHLPDTTTLLSPIEVFTKTIFPDHEHLQRTRYCYRARPSPLSSRWILEDVVESVNKNYVGHPRSSILTLLIV